MIATKLFEEGHLAVLESALCWYALRHRAYPESPDATQASPASEADSGGNLRVDDPSAQPPDR